jgi:methionyl-tRNA synthetase
MSEEKIVPPGPEIATPPKAAEEPKISIEEFAKVEMRVGQILEAEKIEGSRKLIKMRVDIGSEIRQVVAGIAEAYEASALINKKIILVANLKPARLMGVESNGMLLAATNEGKPVIATFASDVPNGALLK